jgi:hypothetical protein
LWNGGTSARHRFITSRNDHPMGLSCQRQQKARKGLRGALLAAMGRRMRSIRRASVAASRKEFAARASASSFGGRFAALRLARFHRVWQHSTTAASPLIEI